METLFIIIIVFVLICLCLVKIRYTHSIHLPPGPNYIPIISDILLLRTSFSQLKPILLKANAKHGPIFTAYFWFTPHIFIFDRFLAHKALIQNAVLFANRPKSLNNNNLINISSTCYGSTWRVLRNNLASVMLHPCRFKSFSKTRMGVMESLLKNLESEAKLMNNSVKLINHVQHAVFCLLAFMCFGENADIEKIEKLKNIQRCFISSTGKFDALAYFPKIVSRILFKKRLEELTQLRKLKNDLLVELIQFRKKVIENNNDDEEGVICYVDTLLNIQLPEEKRKLEVCEIVALCSEFLTSGTDTTATALEWVMANLVKFKHLQQRLVKEIQEVIGERDERYVKEEDLEKLPYLKAVILEGLRRHPLSHYAIPHAVIEDVFLNNYLIPKNGTVNFMLAEIALDPTIWEDPLTFKPERFLRDETSGVKLEACDVSGKKEIKMMPFGVGRRICPAYKLAILHLEYFAANLILNFEWDSLQASSSVDLSEEQEFTMVMKHSLQAQIILRK